MIYPGGNTVQRAFRGNTPIGSVWAGDKLVYPDGQAYQRYKWLSGYHDSAHIYSGYMEISTPQTDHILQPRQSLLQGNSALDGTWVSTFNDGLNWMAGAATAGVWRFTVSGTIYNQQNETYPYISQNIYGGYLDQGAGVDGSDMLHTVFGEGYSVPIETEQYFSYTFDVVKPVTPRNWYFAPLIFMTHSESFVFDIYDLVIGARKIA